jgi:hypothetical protein
VQLGTIKEATSVLEDVFRPVIKNLADEKGGQGLKFGMISKVFFIAESELELLQTKLENAWKPYLLLFNLSFLRLNDTCNADQVVIVD